MLHPPFSSHSLILAPLSLSRIPLWSFHSCIPWMSRISVDGSIRLLADKCASLGIRHRELESKILPTLSVQHSFVSFCSCCTSIFLLTSFIKSVISTSVRFRVIGQGGAARWQKCCAHSHSSPRIVTACTCSPMRECWKFVWNKMCIPLHPFAARALKWTCSSTCELASCLN